MSAISLVYFVRLSWLFTLRAQFYFRFLHAFWSVLVVQLMALAISRAVQLLWIEIRRLQILQALETHGTSWCHLSTCHDGRMAQNMHKHNIAQCPVASVLNKLARYPVDLIGVACYICIRATKICCPQKPTTWQLIGMRTMAHSKVHL